MIGEKVFEIEQRAIEILGRSYKNTHLFGWKTRNNYFRLSRVGSSF